MMDLSRKFEGLDVKGRSVPTDSESFSLTADVLSFRRCSRQYHLLRESNFPPPNATQLYFGTVVHQTLDMAHAHYDETKIIPSNQDVYSFFRAVEDGLFKTGVKPFRMGPKNGAMTGPNDGDLSYEELSAKIGPERASAFVKVRLFNNIFGKELYPSIIDTECRLDLNMKDYTMTGTVDVLKRDQDNIEIWDYKSYESSIFAPDKDGNISKEGKDAIMQMRIYCNMYENRTKEKLSKAVVVCIGDLDPKKS
ncbi:MAG: PD-(D/E)XK nuclease family protein [Methanosarcina mazei]|nr:PD-(D/E)XK nuclease family protein [Methanosarcina mazei]